ncbi:ABC transporter permease [Verticiella sediminum]
MGRFILGSASVAILFFLVSPTFFIVPMSFSASEFLSFPPESWSLRWHEEFMESVQWRDAIRVSLLVAVANVAVSVTLGTMAAYGLLNARSKMCGHLFAALLTPMIFPVILLAVGSFYLYAKIGLLNSILGLVLAHACLSIPIVMILMLAALKDFDFNQERAARVLGATRLKAFFTITFPQIRFATISASLFAFLTSFDEVVISIFISGGENTTLTKRMFTALRDIMEPTVAAISTWVLLLTCVVLIVAQLLAHRPRR